MLLNCIKLQKMSEANVRNLWCQSGLCWDSLGIKEDLEEFLEQHVRQPGYMNCFHQQDVAHILVLSVVLGSDDYMLSLCNLNSVIFLT